MEAALGHGASHTARLYGWLGGRAASQPGCQFRVGSPQPASGAVSRAATSVAARTPDSTAPSR